MRSLTLRVLALLVAALAVFTVPFWQNNLVNWDLVGHLASATFQAEHVFPAITGWNPFFYLGAPHNQLYPPLLNLLAGGLGQLLPPAVALKFVVLLAFLATPLVGYWMARQYRLHRGEALLASFLIVCALFLTRPNGGDAYSTFVIGNVGEALGIPLLLLYSGLLRRSVAHRGFLLSGAVLALAVLANYFVAIAVIIIGFGEAIVALFERRFRRFVPHWLLGGLLAAFFVVPWFASLRYLSSIRFVDQEPFRYVELFLLFVITASLGWVVKRRPSIRPLALSFAVLVAVRFLLPDLIHLPVQIFRLNFFFQLFGAVLLALVLFEVARWWVEKSHLLAPATVRFFVVGAPTLIFVSLLVSRMVVLDIRGVRPDPTASTLPQSAGRTFVIQSPVEHYSQYGLQHLLALQQGRMVNKGLFIESAINARYLLDLEQALVGTESPAYVRTWGIHWDYDAVQQGVLDKTRVPLLRFFGFDSIVTGDELDPAVVALAQEVRQLNESLWYYRFADAPLVEPITTPLVPVQHRWQQQALDWFLTSDHATMLVDAPTPFQPADASTTLKDIQISAMQNDLRFSIDAERPAPILIKISYFPNWKASINGAPAPVYRVSPNLMMVYGSGDVHLWYGRTIWQNLGTALSMVGLLWLGAGFLKSLRGPTNNRGKKSLPLAKF